MLMNFDDFFERTSGKKPYDWQKRLACGEDQAKTASGRPCQSLLINIPTGLGKTAASLIPSCRRKTSKRLSSP
ncbi:MAG: hypothetical protein OHK005_13540 [Candidatus Methylacidiphilales bacterium]